MKCRAVRSKHDQDQKPDEEESKAIKLSKTGEEALQRVEAANEAELAAGATSIETADDKQKRLKIENLQEAIAKLEAAGVDAALIETHKKQLKALPQPSNVRALATIKDLDTELLNTTAKAKKQIDGLEVLLADKKMRKKERLAEQAEAYNKIKEEFEKKMEAAKKAYQGVLGAIDKDIQDLQAKKAKVEKDRDEHAERLQKGYSKVAHLGIGAAKEAESRKQKEVEEDRQATSITKDDLSCDHMAAKILAAFGETRPEASIILRDVIAQELNGIVGQKCTMLQQKRDAEKAAVAAAAAAAAEASRAEAAKQKASNTATATAAATAMATSNIQQSQTLPSVSATATAAACASTQGLTEEQKAQAEQLRLQEIERQREVEKAEAEATVQKTLADLAAAEAAASAAEAAAKASAAAAQQAEAEARAQEAKRRAAKKRGPETESQSGLAKVPALDEAEEEDEHENLLMLQNLRMLRQNQAA